MGEIEDVIERATEGSLIPIAALLAAITEHLKKSASLEEARETLLLIKWLKRKGFEEITFDNLLVGDCFGRLEVAISDLGLKLNIPKEATYGGLSPKEAIKIFKRKKIMPKDAFQKLSDAYRAKSFTVAGLTEQYTLERMHEILTEAISEGISKDQFLKDMDKLYDSWGLTHRGRHHLETVFDTNVIGGYQYGRYCQQSSKDVLKARPYWRYRTSVMRV